MTKSPFVNAFVALLYIVIVASIMFYGPEFTGRQQKETIIIPFAVISLFTLSAAVMAYVFGYQPLQLFLEGKKTQAVDLFLKTVGVFGVITLILLLILFSGVIS